MNSEECDCPCHIYGVIHDHLNECCFYCDNCKKNIDIKYLYNHKIGCMQKIGDTSTIRDLNGKTMSKTKKEETFDEMIKRKTDENLRGIS